MAAVDPVPWVDPDVARLDEELAALGEQLAQAEAELVEARARLEAFARIRDRLLLPLYAELAQIEARISGAGAADSGGADDGPGAQSAQANSAQAQPGQAGSAHRRRSGRPDDGQDAGTAKSRARARGSASAAADPADLRAVPPAEARRLYRALAKRCHPDLGGGEADRERRRAFMVRVNDAYASGDTDLLAWLATEWDPAEAVAPARGEVRPDRLQRLRAVLETARRRLAQVRAELAAVTGTGLGLILFQQEDSAMEAAISRLDVLADLVRSRIDERRQVLEELLGEGS